MLKIKNLTFGYADKPVLQDLNLMVKQGEIWAIVGESGAGKSTLLKLVYGQYDLDNGHIYYRDEEIFGPKFNLISGADSIKYVSQESDLMPFTSVRNNVGKFLSNFYLAEKEERIVDLLTAVGLTDYTSEKVKNLSGGQKQRVALAQALAKQPKLLLLDEPFSHIDNFQKDDLRRDLFRYIRQKNIGCIMATHDKEDVLGFADQMLVLDAGKMMATGSPETLYINPREPVIAAFFDTYNELPVSLFGETDSDERIIVYAHEIEVSDRAETVVEIAEVFFKGHHYLNRAKLKGEDIFFYSKSKYKPGKPIGIVVADAIIDKRMKSKIEERIERK